MYDFGLLSTEQAQGGGMSLIIMLLVYGLFFAALGIALFIPVAVLSRLLIRGVSQLFRSLRGKLISKKEGFA